MAERTAQKPSRKIPEKDLPKKVGEEVVLPDGTQYVISGVYGKAGLMHTAEGSGRWFIGWHDPQDPTLIVMHGGTEGIPDMFIVRRQLIHIIDRYQGVSIPIAGRDWVEEESEGRQLTFSGLAQQLELTARQKAELGIPDEYSIAGEQPLIGEWVSQLQGINRKLPNIRGSAQLKMAQEDVTKIASKLTRSTNQFKQSAYQRLERGIRGSQAELLAALMKTQIDLLERAQEIVGKTSGVMARLNELDIVQVSWNRIVEGLPSSLSHIAVTMDSAYLEERRNRALGSFLNERSGVFWKLNQLTGEPYFSRAQRYIRALNPVQNHWQRKNLQAIKNLVDGQNVSVKEWEREIRDQQEGTVFGRFAQS